MAVFDENVTVNGDFGVVGDVTIHRQGDGVVVLDLGTERRWHIRQLGSGPDAALEFASIGGAAEGQPIANKNLIINTTGRVGIGTTTPEHTLEVNGNIGVGGGLDIFGGVTIRRRGDGAMLLNFGTERSWQIRQLGSGPNAALEFASIGGAAEGQPIANKNLIINTTGRVGIGTTAPEHTLDVNGSIRAADDVILAGADCAEEFDVDPASEVEPGTVMIIGSEQRLRHSTRPYDRRVAGIISGMGDRRPGIVLGRRKLMAGAARIALALTGTVVCKVDATEAAIDAGDLLTTSSRPGHAMRATDAGRSFGSVVGKALDNLMSGIGTIPVLIALR